MFQDREVMKIHKIKAIPMVLHKRIKKDKNLATLIINSKTEKAYKIKVQETTRIHLISKVISIHI